MLRTPIDRLRTVGFLEGISFLLLLGVAMPLKYVAGMPVAVSIVGALHGGLFVLYLLAVAHVTLVHKWPLDRAMLAVVAAVLPFGPFVFDRMLLKRDGGALGAPGAEHG